jgi:glycosyltransferase involved in cell wall biosynthesis
VYQRASRYIVFSNAFRDVLSQKYGVDEAKIRIVPGQVDTERFNTMATRREARQNLGWPLDRPIVVCVRRLVSRMGLEELITAVSLVRRAHPDILLHIAGKGPLAHELQNRIDGEGLTGFVRLLGYISDSELPTIYRAANLSVVPTSSLEGFGLIAAESLASGTPVLVTPVGGLPEVVTDLAPTLVTASARAGDIADSLRAALSGRLSLPTEEQCRTYAVAKFERRTVAGQIKQVYEEAIASA